MKGDENLRAAGREIKQHRETRGLSQEALAEKAGLHRNYIGLIERGERNASLKALFAIAAALDMGLAELFASLHPQEPAKRSRGKG